MWNLSVTHRMPSDIYNIIIGNGHCQHQPFSCNVNTVSASQRSIAPMLTPQDIKPAARQSAIRRMMRRMAGLLADVNNFFHQGNRQLSRSSVSGIQPARETMIPLLDKHSVALAEKIIDDFPVPLPSCDNKQHGLEYLVYFIGLAVVRLAEADPEDIADISALEEACDIINTGVDHPGMAMLLYVNNHYKENKSFASSLLVQAVEIGRMDFIDVSYEEYNQSLNAMAKLWSYIIGKHKNSPLKRTP